MPFGSFEIKSKIFEYRLGERAFNASVTYSILQASRISDGMTYSGYESATPLPRVSARHWLLALSPPRHCCLRFLFTVTASND